MSVSTCIIFNPNSGSAEELKPLLRRIEARPQTRLAATRRPDDSRRLAIQAIRDGHRLIVCAGGDGTVNSVVNGIMLMRQEVTLGIVPLGTGNDLPRTLDIPTNPIEAIELLDRGQSRRIDLIKARFGKNILYGHNVAAGGFTGQVNEKMTDELKKSWGPLAYLRGAVSVLPDLTRYHTWIRFDGERPKEVPAMNVIIANGRTAGGGIAVAPHANPEDGLLDVVLVHPGSLLELTAVTTRLLVGDYTKSDLVTHRRARRVEVHSRPGMWFNLDGELLTKQRTDFSVAPRALHVIVGQNYQPEP